MPPTAFEIKARLDKAVDQEGNVINFSYFLLSFVLLHDKFRNSCFI